jgi:hypothetical protein
MVTRPRTTNTTVEVRTPHHSVRVRRDSERPVKRSSSSRLPHATVRSVKMAQMLMSRAQTTLAMPTQPSSTRSLGTATIRIMSINKITEMTSDATWPALDGVEKKRSTTSSKPRVKVVNEKSKNPDPRECIPGGLMKIETNNKTHQRKVMMAKSTEK